MTIELVHVSSCWCGSEQFTPFADHYLQCEECGTLINSPRLPEGCFSVGDGAGNFYSKRYWFAYQREQHGLPDIIQRASDDLAGRCLYWLDAVLRYKRPPGRSIEIGCSHGGFVALMKMAGFDAMGVELSPWVADYAAKTFDVSVRSGTLGDLQIAPESVDCMILMDVLEHLPDPKAMMCDISRALKPDGIVVIQTPCYRNNGPSWEMLIDQEHLFLFTADSLRRLLYQVGLSHVDAYPQLFPHDMFFIAGRSPLMEISRQAAEVPRLQTPVGRLLTAMLDLYARFTVSQQEWGQRLSSSEADRAARQAVIEEQGQRMGSLEGERNALWAESNQLRQRIAAIEADRAARQAVIEEQGQRMGSLEGERNALWAESNQLRQRIAAIEADRAARQAVIEEQGQRMGSLEGERNALWAESNQLRQRIAAIEADRAARQAVIEEQGQRMGSLEGERDALRQQLEASEMDRAARLVAIEKQGLQLGALEQEHNKVQVQLAGLQQQLCTVQAENQRVLRALITLSRTRSYRLLRRIGRWQWLEQTLVEVSPRHSLK